MVSGLFRDVQAYFTWNMFCDVEFVITTLSEELAHVLDGLVADVGDLERPPVLGVAVEQGALHEARVRFEDDGPFGPQGATEGLVGSSAAIAPSCSTAARGRRMRSTRMRPEVAQ